MSSANIDINANAINYGLWINELKKMFPLPSSFLLQSNVWKYYLTCLVFTSYNNAWWTGVEGVSQCLLISLMQAFNNQKMGGRKSCLRLKQFRKITWRQASNFLLVRNCLERFRMTEVGALLAGEPKNAVSSSVLHIVYFSLFATKTLFLLVFAISQKKFPGRKETSFV